MRYSVETLTGYCPYSAWGPTPIQETTHVRHNQWVWFVSRLSTVTRYEGGPTSIIFQGIKALTLHISRTLFCVCTVVLYHAQTRLLLRFFFFSRPEDDHSLPHYARGRARMCEFILTAFFSFVNLFASVGVYHAIHARGVEIKGEHEELDWKQTQGRIQYIIKQPIKTGVTASTNYSKAVSGACVCVCVCNPHSLAAISLRTCACARVHGACTKRKMRCCVMTIDFANIVVQIKQ